MKYLVTFSTVLIFFINTQKDQKLNGKYLMQYEQKYSSQNCVIAFHDSVYTRRISNGKSIKGHIIYNKFSVSLNDDKSNLEMDFARREMQKDTVFFGTKDLNDKLSSSDLTINLGKLIKIK